jgi:predicted enzyme related to lactoylglutathione lyase
VPVDNIERAAAFYAHVLGMDGERVSGGRHYFRCGQVLLACYDPVADGDEPGHRWRYHPSQYLYFAVDHLEDTLLAVERAGGTITGGIGAMPWGERMFYARDPFGTPISFVDATTVFTGGQYFG